MSEEPTEQPKRGDGIHSAGGQPVIKAWCLGIVGAVVGGVVGWFVFAFLVSQGFYALALPGALVGLGFGGLSRRPMIAGGIFCAIVAVALMVFCEWHHWPMIEDESLGFFLTHLHDLRFMTWLFLGIGAICAFWFGRGRD